MFAFLCTAKLLQSREQRKTILRHNMAKAKYNNNQIPPVTSNNKSNNDRMQKKKSASATSVNKVNFQKNDLQSSSRSVSASRDNKNTRSNLRGYSTYYTSDTESNEGTLHFSGNCDNCDIPISSRSVPDLRGNLDFRKVAGTAWSPRHCLCHLDIRDQDILTEYFKRYAEAYAMLYLVFIIVFIYKVKVNRCILEVYISLTYRT